MNGSPFLCNDHFQHKLSLLGLSPFSRVTNAFFFPKLGARAQRASVLEKLEELMEAEERLDEKEKALQDSKKELAILKRKADEYVSINICLVRKMF